MLISGDWAAGTLATQQKAKLAAAEALFKTQSGAPLIIGGWPDPLSGTVHYGLEIPKLLSYLAHEDLNAVVVGLDAFPPGTAPDPRLVHPFFDLMVGSFFIMSVAAGLYWWSWLRKRPCSRLLLTIILFAAPFGIIALESGWFVTEFGRQPWAVAGIMRVADAVTPNPGVVILLFIVAIVYLVLTFGLLKLLLGSRIAPEVEEHHE
jgi:cytochrome d ubiquinol oxidase subunit I